MSLLSRAALWVVCLGVAAYAIVVYSFLPLGAVVAPAMRAAFESNAAAIHVHVFASALALAIGPAQFSQRLRLLHPSVHRWLGRVYLGVGVGVGGAAGLVMATHATGGLWARLGFGLLAVAWLYSGVRAYLAARGKSFVAHRRWMVRNFSLTLAAVTLRLYLPSALAAGIAFEQAYPIIAWLCWVPNLLLAEMFFNQAQARIAANPTAVDRA